MKKNEKKPIQPQKRLSALLIFCAIGVVIIVGRLFWLQFLNTEYKQKMLELTRKTVTLNPARGEITDRAGYALAYDEKSYVLYLFPEDIEEKNELRAKLVEILDVMEEQVNEWFSQEGEVRVDMQLENEQADAIQDLEISGISLITQNQRRYPEGLLSSGIVGFTNADHNGVMGVEQYYDEELRGIPGKMQLYSYGGGIPSPYEQTTLYPAKKGNTIALTLDATIQDIVMKQGRIGYDTFTPEKMAIIVMNPNTGEVLGIGDFPALDANQPRQGRTEAEKKEIERLNEQQKVDKYNEIWRSFSFQDVYEPGSVFKMVTAAAAYEEGTATDDTVYHCDGYVTDIPGVTIRCWSYYDPHGDLTLTEAMDESCNPSFVQMIRQLGKVKSRHYIDAFGFGKPTGIGMPSEEGGLVPPGPESINEADFATNSYGHGIAVTPLQMITAISAIANGGTLYQPQIVYEIKDEQGNVVQPFEKKPLRTVISEETSLRMRELLEHGAIHGTADGSHIPGYRIGGKTGTSIKVVDGAYTSEVVVGSYAGVFPAMNPEIAVIVVVDEPKESTSGNTSAAPIAKLIIQEYIRIKGIPPTEPIESDVPDNGTVDPITYPVESIIEDSGDTEETPETGSEENADAGEEPESGDTESQTEELILEEDEP